MRKLIEIFVAACFYYTGLVKFARWWARRWGSGLIIAAYHQASEGDLRPHLLYLRRHYRIMHLEEALEEVYTSPGDMKPKGDRRIPLVLTFDDGYYDNYTHAFPLICELQIPITIFLIPGYIENRAYFWWLEGQHLAHQAQVVNVTIEGRTYNLEKVEERELLAQVIDDRVRYASSVGEREAFLASVRKKLAVPSSVPTEEEAVRPLRWEEVRKMEESGWVSFGGHTMHHPILGYLSNPEEVRREVEDCRRVLEQHLGHPVRTFAYPVGKPEHIGNVAPKAVREADYNWAVTTTHGTSTSQNDPYQLPRVMCESSRHWLVTAAQISGVWNFFSPLWKWRKTLLHRKYRSHISIKVYSRQDEVEEGSSV